MTDYTPTTEDVSEAYARGACEVYDDGTNCPECRAEFYHWFANELAKARADEREKCIRIAEDRAIDMHYCTKDDDCEMKARGIDLVVADLCSRFPRGRFGNADRQGGEQDA